MSQPSAKSREKGKQIVPVEKIISGKRSNEWDAVIKEAPLEIHIAHGPVSNRQRELLSVTLRTPGEDFNLVTGFLFAEHIIRRASDIISIRFAGNYQEEVAHENVLIAELAPDIKIDLSARRNFLTSAACGFCGRSSFDTLGNEGLPIPFSNSEKISTTLLHQLPSKLAGVQGLFAETGGSHAVALLTVEGNLLQVFEDVGRHNAMDKLIGFMLKQDALPLTHSMALFSGRLGYELVQKSIAAGIPVICSIGAPSGLAIEMASDHNMTVVGFLKKNSMNIYCGAERIITNEPSAES